MQREYPIISAQYNLRKYDRFCQDGWIAVKKNIGEMIKCQPNRNFLSHADIGMTMVKSGGPSKFEEAYLLNCLSYETKNKIAMFKDIDKSWLSHTSVIFDCSTNSLGQLYYAAKIFEQVKNKKIDTIVEFGGGFGCLARILKMIDPSLTIFIIDLPEFISLQALFLRETLDSKDVIVHYDAPKEYKNGRVKLSNTPPHSYELFAKGIIVR